MQHHTYPLNPEHQDAPGVVSITRITTTDGGRLSWRATDYRGRWRAYRTDRNGCGLWLQNHHSGEWIQLEGTAQLQLGKLPRAAARRRIIAYHQTR